MKGGKTDVDGDLATVFQWIICKFFFLDESRNIVPVHQLRLLRSRSANSQQCHTSWDVLKLLILTLLIYLFIFQRFLIPTDRGGLRGAT